VLRCHTLNAQPLSLILFPEVAEGETERGRQRVRKRARQRDRKTERQKDRETERQKDRETVRQKDRETVRKKGRETERQRDRETSNAHPRSLMRFPEVTPNRKPGGKAKPETLRCRGTSLKRKRPPLGPYSRPLPKGLGWY